MTQSIRDQYGEFRKLLLHRRNLVLQQTNAERAELEMQNNTFQGTVGDAGDSSVIDASTDYFLQLADNDRRTMIEIQDAFARMKRGVYGICEACDEEIDIERLRHLPEARCCIECQAIAELKYRAAHPLAAPKL